MRRLILLIVGVASLAAPAIEAASLNKCTDAQGRVTYSNLPCNNAREVSKLEIDPAPAPDPVRKPAAKPAAAKPASAREPDAAIKLDTQRSSGKNSTHTSVRQCDSLSDKLGKVFDKMDDARRQGYTQKQMNDWNSDVKELERKKQQAGCF